MKKIHLLVLAILMIPGIASAQTSLQNVLNGLLTFIDGVLVPFLFGIAFLFFVFNIVRYLVLDGGNEEARDNAKNLALYGFGAFVFLIIFWGIVNLVVDSLGLNCGAIQPDYVGQSSSAPCTSTPRANSCEARGGREVCTTEGNCYCEEIPTGTDTNGAQTFPVQDNNVEGFPLDLVGDGAVSDPVYDPNVEGTPLPPL